MKKLIIFLILIYCGTNYAQTLYVLDQLSKIKTFNQNGQPSLVKQLNTSFSDIAVSSLGEIYLSNGSSLYHYDTSNDDLVQIFVMPSNIGYVPSLTAGHNNDLYFLSNFYQFCRYDITNNTLEILDTFSVGTPGDIAFYKGNILFQVSGNNKIRAYNIYNQTMNIVFCLPDFFGNSFGIANHVNSCGDNTIIISKNNEFHELDLENNTITLLDYSHDQIIFGLATDTEYLAANCNTTLTANLCYLSVDDYNFLNSEIIFYPNPVEDNLIIKEQIKYDSLSIIDINGRVISVVEGNLREIDVSRLESGVYFFEIVKGEQSRIEKFVKN